jgi:hypothetical protein
VSRRLGALFAAACVHATPQATTDAFLQRVLDLVERAAEADDWNVVAAVEEEADERCGRVESNSPAHFWALATLRLCGESIDYYAFRVPFLLLNALAEAENMAGLRRAYAAALRDVVGNAFRGGRGRRMKKPAKRHPFPVLESAHLTDTVVAVAQGMYESRDFGGMPILADALQDAGCTSEDILNHCRGQGPHACGCWVVDSVLGKG